MIKSINRSTVSQLLEEASEALAVVGQNTELRSRCRSNWVTEVRRMPEGQHPLALNALGQLAMAPRVRCNLATREGEEMVGSEELAWFEPDQYQISSPKPPMLDPSL